MKRPVSLLVTSAMLTASLFSGVSGYASVEETAEASFAEVVQEHLSYFNTSSDELVSVIVKLAAEPAATHAAAYKNQGQAVAAAAKQKQLQKVQAERGKALQALQSKGIKAQPKFTFEEAYNGFVITLPASQLSVLATIPNVAGIYEDAGIVQHYNIEDAVPATELEVSVPAVNAQAAWVKGFTGKGKLVAILDDGVEWSHPDLGGCFGPGCKVVDGYDFVSIKQDPSPITGDYHGTHVAATAAGLKGVAPEANILGVRVLGSGARNNLGTVMAGLDFAVRKGADVANMSLGLTTSYGPQDNPWAEMVTNAVKAGVVMANSNGNNGPAYYTVGMYAVSPDTIAVGNSDARRLPFPRTTLSTGEALVGGAYGAVFPADLLGKQLTIVDVGHGNAPSDYEGKDVAGKVVIAQRGGPGDAAFVNKGNQAAAHGAAALIIYNHVTGWGDFSTADLAVPSFTLSHTNGLKVLANPTVTIENFDAGVTMAGGSSRGPSVDLQIKPDVSAPGTGIVAAAPYHASPTGYVNISGTSMSTPHVAGAAAILLQANPTWTPQQVKLALMNSAGNLTDLFGNTYRTVDQGAGFIDLGRALEPRLSINPGSVSFGQILPGDNFTKTKSLTVNTYVTGGKYKVTTELLKPWAGISVTANTSQVHLTGAKRTHQFNLTATIDPAVAVAGEYEGYLYLTNTENHADTYRVPFFFVYKAPVSEIKLSNNFVGAGANQFVDVTFNVGQPLTNWYLGSMANTRFTADQGPAGVGTVTYNWNGRTAAGLNLGEGGWNMGVWYQLPGSSTWQFSLTYARLHADRTAPQIRIAVAPPAATNNPVLTITGAVSDAAMSTYGAVAGTVFVNGQAADLTTRTPAQLFTTLQEIVYSHSVKLNEGANTITIQAVDAAGNKSAVLTYNVVLDTMAELALTNLGGAAQYQYNSTALVVEGKTEAGATVTINGETVTVNEDLTFAHPVTLVNGTNVLVIRAVDALGNTTTAEKRITVQAVRGTPVLTPVR